MHISAYPCILIAVTVVMVAAVDIDYRLNPHNLPEPSHKGELRHRPAGRTYRQLHSKNGTELVPVYAGYGTHYTFIYVGNPPQRQSVIIDTGSHITAFPCTGCKQCGSHTDPYFMPSNSSTAQALQCSGNKKCEISQSYSEGSSWKAYKVKDEVYLAGGGPNDNRHATEFRLNFTFGCQTYETGLFRTQLEEGIMGLSNQAETIPHQLFSQGKSKSKMFALCYRLGGGIITLGGVDRRIHHSIDTIHFAKYKASGSWYGVIVKNIQFQIRGGANDGQLVEIGNALVSSFQSGKGSIVDSGTTDTYLPRSLSTAFSTKFKELTGMVYSNKEQHLDSKQLEKIPNIVYTLQGVKSEDVVVTVLWSAYTEELKNGKRAFRVYLTESSGAVLGANFMDG